MKARIINHTKHRLTLWVFGLWSVGFTLSSSWAEEPRVLMRETFNGSGKEGFAAKALEHPRIRLAENAGADGTNAICVEYVGFERGSQRVSLKFPLTAKVEGATLSFDVRFDQEFRWTRGGKLHGLAPRKSITGGRERQPEGWSARTVFKQDGRCATYLYDQDKIKKYGIGEATEAPVFVAGKWHHVALQVRLNDPGQSNGFARIRVDGKPVVTTRNVVFRGVGGPETLIQQFLFSTFHGGSDRRWTPVDDNGDPTTVYAYFDNFLVVEGVQEGMPGSGDQVPQ